MQYHPSPSINKSQAVINENILETLAYFDLFDYPLSRAEIYLFLKNKHPVGLFDDALNGLLEGGLIHQFDTFYALKNDHYLVVRRNENNKKAAELIKVAEKAGNFLICFPFVRGIAILGTLSKNHVGDRSDTALFIITAKNRLWIARTIVHCFTKLTLLVKKKPLLCVDYFIDEQHLETAEKNLYTAIEIATLVPLQGDTVFEQFFAANAWTRRYLPNNIMRIACAKAAKNRFFKRLFEALLNNPAGSRIDDTLMELTAGRWLNKARQNKSYSPGAAMEAGKHFAKPDLKNYQNTLLLKYYARVSRVLRMYQDSLTH